MAALLRFQLGSKTFAVAVERVREILRMPELSELPDVSPSRRGLLDLRGHVIPVYDIRPVLGIAAGELRPDQYVLILQPNAPIGGASETGLIADDVHGVLPLEPGALGPVSMADTGLAIYEAVVRQEEGLLTVLSIEGMVRAARAFSPKSSGQSVAGDPA